MKPDEMCRQKLEEFCDLSENIYEPFVDEPLHELRIAAKRLRYAVELYTACWGERIVPFADGIAEIQVFWRNSDAMWVESLSKGLRKADENAANIWLCRICRKTHKNTAALNLWSDGKN